MQRRSRLLASLGLSVAALTVTVAIAAPPLVERWAKISERSGDFRGDLNRDDFFGNGVAAIGDLDGDGIGDLAVGTPHDDDGGFDTGAVWILFLNSDGTVKDEQKISDTAGGFAGILDEGDEFGTSVALIGDVDGDGTDDLAVGAPYDDDGSGFASGALWILFMNPDGTVKGEQKISDVAGDFDGELLEGDLFGFSIAGLGDLDGDGFLDIAVGAPLDDDGAGIDKGAVWILFLRGDGSVDGFQKISEEAGGFFGRLTPGDTFATSVAAIGDVDGDGITELAVGSPFDDDGQGGDKGAVWILFLEFDGRVLHEQKISDLAGGFEGPIDEADYFGWATATLGDVDGDGIPDLGVGVPLDDAGPGIDGGAVWILLLNADGTVKNEQRFSQGTGGFFGRLEEGDTFGTSLTALGDIDGDGTGDLAVGAPLDNDGAINAGAVWILFLTQPPRACGDADGSGDLAATDALIALNTAVGLGTCELCVCDVDSSSSVTATDAQRILRSAVGLGGELICPACI